MSATQRFYGAAEDVYSVSYYRILKASPHDAHLALASLSIPSVRKRLQVLPSLVDQSKQPLYITQNTDGLCRHD